MRFAIVFALALFALGTAAPGDVVSFFTAPAGNPDGLTWINSNIWITSDDTNMIYECDPTSGNVLNSFAGHGAATLLSRVSAWPRVSPGMAPTCFHVRPSPSITGNFRVEP